MKPHPNSSGSAAWRCRSRAPRTVGKTWRLALFLGGFFCLLSIQARSQAAEPRDPSKTEPPGPATTTVSDRTSTKDPETEGQETGNQRPQGQPAPTSQRGSSPYRWALGLSASEGGFWAKELGWVREDTGLRLWAGLRLRRVLELQAGMDASVERLLMGLRLSAHYIPWARGPYVKVDLALRFSAAGPQVGLGTGLGFSWAFRFPLGLFIEAELLGWLNEPRALALGVHGGLFVPFGE